MNVYSLFVGAMLTAALTVMPAGRLNAQQRTMSIISEGRERPIRTYVHGMPVYSYGSTYIYGESPDFIKGVKLQEGNSNPITKIKLKKSWEIRESMLGGHPPRLPRTEMMDRWQAPLLPINLIDDDSETYWCSRGQTEADVQPEWIRLDLPKETLIKSVVLQLRTRPYRVSWQIAPSPKVKAAGDGVPQELTIKLSRDAWHWETVVHKSNYSPPADQKRLEFSFPPRPAKQVWIIGNKLPLVDCWGFAFSMAGVEVRDIDGDDVALASRGTGVTVSSTEATYPDSRAILDDLWATSWDLGLKWMRVAAWDSVLQWSYVEREKGKYYIDPKADEAITEAAENGINIILSLCYGNWLYTPEGKRQWQKETTEILDLPPPPMTEEAQQAFLNFARFMARHFRGRVKYFCIWNEPYASPPYGWGDPKKFSDFVKRVVPVIKEEDPEAKIAWPTALTSGPFLEGCLKEGIAPLFDLVHSDQGAIKQSRKMWESAGFKGKYILWEWHAEAPYPPPSREAPYTAADKVLSELQKAKRFAQDATSAASENIIFCVVEWFNTYQPIWDVGLFRNTLSADPVSPTQPQAAYYVTRNLGTILAETRPSPLSFTLSNKTKPLTVYTFRKNSEPMIALWSSTVRNKQFKDIVTATGFNLGRDYTKYASADNTVDVKTDVTFPNLRAVRAIAYDSLNGLRQELAFKVEGASTVIPNVLAKDYPIFILLQTSRRRAEAPADKSK